MVTGVADTSVAHAARVLADRRDEFGIEKVIGVDSVLPQGDLGDVKFLRADIRTPVVAKILAVEDVDTVAHLALRPYSARNGGKELNVIGSMQVLAACQRNPAVRRFVLGSSTAFYGSSARDPALWTESGAARAGASAGFPKDVVEVESYTRGFARRRPDAEVTTLRFAQVMWPATTAPLASYLKGPMLPVIGGFDPRLQAVHIDDATEVFVRAVTGEVTGTFNVAGPGVMLLSQISRLLGHPTVAVPPIGGAGILRQMAAFMGNDITADLPRLLTYGRGVDITALREVFGYSPKHTTRETFELFAASRRPGVLHWRRPKR
jgi:UDP-glucose 4-epimerase